MSHIDGEKVFDATAQWHEAKLGWKAARVLMQNNVLQTRKGAKEFTDRLNMASQAIISATGFTDPDMMDSLGEVATNAANMLRGRPH